MPIISLDCISFSGLAWTFKHSDQHMLGDLPVHSENCIWTYKMIKANIECELMTRGKEEGTVHSFDRVSSVNSKQKTYALK